VGRSPTAASPMYLLALAVELTAPTGAQHPVGAAF
jgi:hypothetical protein